MNYDDQLWVEAFLEFLSLPNVDQLYQDCLDKGCTPGLVLRDGDETRTLQIKLFTYDE